MNYVISLMISLNLNLFSIALSTTNKKSKPRLSSRSQPWSINVLNPDEAFFFPQLGAAAAEGAGRNAAEADAAAAAAAAADAESTLLRLFRQLWVPRSGRGDGSGRGRSHSEGFNPKQPPNL